MPDEVNEYNDAMETRGKRRMDYRRYYDGKHLTQLSDRQRRYLQLAVDQEFNDNYCPVVVDALAERMSVTGFSVTGGQTDTAADAVSEMIWNWWKLNRMDQVQGDTHTSVVRDGDTYILVEYENDLQIPRIRYEPAYDGDCGTEVVYGSKRGRAEYAIKIWGYGEKKRKNVYYPDRIHKYTNDGGGWVPYIDDDDSEKMIDQGVYDWTDGNGNPLGIPIIHFRNRGQGYNYGSSELQDVIPIQNALNKAIIDLVAAADTTAFRIYWMVGDDPSTIEIVPGSWVFTEKKPDEAQIGHIPGEDLSKLIEFKDAFASEIARVSRTPLSYFQLTRQVASGESLKQQESGLVSRAKNRQVPFGNSWEDVMRMCIKLHNTFGPDPALDETVLIETQWQDPETRDDKTHLEELEIKSRLGVPYETLWGEMGYSRDQINGMMTAEEYKIIRAQKLLAVVEQAVSAGYSPEPFLRWMGFSDDEISALYTNLAGQ